jgi:SHS2 domain-containing protein
MLLDARSDKPAQLFEEVARQLFSHLIDPQDVGTALREKIAVDGESMEHLLEEWVRTLLELVRSQKMIFVRFNVTELQTPGKGPYNLRAEVTGELWDEQRHALRLDIGKLSRIEVHLHKEPGLYHAEVDIGPTRPKTVSEN